MLKRLRQAREEAQYTQERAARALGMKHASFISKVESGERRLDALELQDLAAIYDKPLEFFIPGD